MKTGKPQFDSVGLRIVMIAAGIIAIITGAIKIIEFVNKIPQHETMSSSQFIYGLIIPHVILLGGMVITAGGIILMIKHTVIKSRTEAAPQKKTAKQN